MFPSFDVCGKFIAAPGGYGGVDHIKVALDSGYDAYSASLPLLTIKILYAICDETHIWGKKVSAHVTASDSLEIYDLIPL